jgi:hypothetical protein
MLTGAMLRRIKSVLKTMQVAINNKLKKFGTILKCRYGSKVADYSSYLSLME